MKKTSSLFLSVLICSIILSQFISAVPQLPMIVTGNVSINDKPAKIGTEVSARLNLNSEEVENVKTTEKGKFNFLLQNLNENDIVAIYVDNIYSGQNIPYKSGDFQQLNLKVDKSYLIYYIGGIIALAVILTWKFKKIK